MSPVLALLAALAPQDPGPTLSVRGPSPGVVRLGQSAQLLLKIEGRARDTHVVPPHVDGLTIRVGPPTRMFGWRSRTSPER